MVFMPRVNDPDWTTLQYSINDRITEDLDKSIFTIRNNLQNCVTIMITIYRKKDSRINYSSFLS